MAGTDSTKPEVFDVLRNAIYDAQSICSLIKSHEEPGGAESSHVGNAAGVAFELLTTALNQIEALEPLMESENHD
jgi:hypothetical protein